MAERSKILLVDDEKAITANLRPFLERSGFLIEIAADGEEALEQIHGFDPDSIVLDVLMPRLDGREVLRRLRRAYMGPEELHLTPKASALLEYLMTHPDELLSRDRLLDVVWGWDYPAGTRTVDTRIAEIRRALDDDPSDPLYIETVPGQGYRFVGIVEAG